MLNRWRTDCRKIRYTGHNKREVETQITCFTEEQGFNTGDGRTAYCGKYKVQIHHEKTPIIIRRSPLRNIAAWKMKAGRTL
jgi:hypothetical protein